MILGMNSADRKKVQAIIQNLKDEYLEVRGDGGLGRDPLEANQEVEETSFFDLELAAAFAIRTRMELAEAMGILDWVKPESELD